MINNGYLGMVRQWQEFFYERRYSATPLVSPDFVKLAEAYGIRAQSVTTRAGVVPAVQAARAAGEATLIEFVVEQEDTVYPMVPAGADLHQMIRRPSPTPPAERPDAGSVEVAPQRDEFGRATANPIVETGADT